MGRSISATLRPVNSQRDYKVDQARVRLLHVFVMRCDFMELSVAHDFSALTAHLILLYYRERSKVEDWSLHTRMTRGKYATPSPSKLLLTYITA